MYDVKIALNTLLSVIYLSKKLGINDIDESLIKNTLDVIKTPEHANEDDESSAISYIKGIVAEEMYKKEFDKKDIIRRVKIATSLFPDYANHLEIYLSDEHDDSPDDLRKTIASHMMWIRQFINKSTLKNTVGQLYGALSRNDTTTIEKQITLLKQSFDTEREGGDGNTRIPGLVNSINTKERGGFASAIIKAQEIQGGAVFKTGFTGVNQMLSQQGGIKMSELILMPALPFNGKTLFSQSIFLSIGAVNEAEKFAQFIPKDKEPMFLDISFENTPDINIPQAFEMVYGNLAGANGADQLEIWKRDKQIQLIGDKDMASLDKDAFKLLNSECIKYAADLADDYMSKALSKNGWTYQFDQIINTEFSITYLADLISMYESRGYHIMGVRGDYLGTIKKDGLGNGVAGTDIKESYRLARNYTAMRDKFALLPHQLSPEAKRFKAIDPIGFIKNLPGKGYYELCSSLDNEADTEFYFGVTDQESKRYLEVQRGKSRGNVKTQSCDMYTVIPFDKDRILPWDVLDVEKGGLPLCQNSLSKFASTVSSDLDWG